MRKFKFRRKHLPIAGLLVVIILLLGQNYGWFGSPKSVQSSQPGLYSIAKFDDGDTIVVNTTSGKETIRFIGVDTPETHDPRKPVQCYGPEASAYTKKIIGTQKVRLKADPLDTNRDRYGRLLRYIYLPDGTLLNQKLIEQGYGFYYPYFPFSKKPEFAAAEKQAQKQKLGLWSHCKPIPTDHGGYNSNPIGS